MHGQLCGLAGPAPACMLERPSRQRRQPACQPVQPVAGLGDVIRSIFDFDRRVVAAECLRRSLSNHSHAPRTLTHTHHTRSQLGTALQQDMASDRAAHYGRGAVESGAGCVDAARGAGVWVGVGVA